jgi:hypothetical protein
MSTSLDQLSESKPQQESSRSQLIVRSRWFERAMVATVLSVIGLVHAVDMNYDPQTWNVDAGTYMMQAWAVAALGRITPYSYTYDHAPGGWIQIGILARLFNGFGIFSSAIAFGNTVSLVYALATALLLYLLARRLRFSLVAAAAVPLLWGLCPLAMEYARPAYLDNIVTPWLLLAFYLALNPRKHIWISALGGVAFGIACLSKETTIVVFPALVYAYVQNRDRRNFVRTCLLTLGGCCVMALYPWYAEKKGELFPRHGRDTLIGEAKIQLFTRASSGSIFNPYSAVRVTLSQWLHYDRYLFAMGLAGILLAVWFKHLRPAILALLIQTAMIVKGGYVPAMQIADITPWAALVSVGAVWFGLCCPRQPWSNSTRLLPRLWLLGRRIFAVTTMLAFAVIVAPKWATGDAQFMSFNHPVPLQQAEWWVADNVPRSDTLVVDSTLWTDLGSRYGFSHVVEETKIDADPRVVKTVRSIDYIVVANNAFTGPDAKTVYPSLVRALRYSLVVATFGSGPNGVRVLRVGEDFTLRL